MDSKLIVAIIVLIGVVAVLGGYYGYEAYKSNTYNDLLLKTDGSNGTWIQARNILNETATGMFSTSYDTSIENSKKSMNLTDQSINMTAEMMSIAPDNATREYARIRNNQFKNAKKMEEVLLKLLQDIKSSGLLGAAVSNAGIENETTKINEDMTNDQNALIQLVNNNPQLKQRLIDVLGTDRTNEILKPLNSTA